MRERNNLCEAQTFPCQNLELQNPQEQHLEQQRLGSSKEVFKSSAEHEGRDEHIYQTNRFVVVMESSNDSRAGKANHATVLHVAAIQGSSSDLMKLLEDASSRDQLDNQHPQSGQTPLSAAVFYGAPLANVKALVLAKASLHFADTHGNTALDWAISRNNKDVLEYMLGFFQGNEFVLCGYSLRGGTSQSVLNYALLKPDNGVLELLLEAKADPTKPGLNDSWSLTPLFTAAMFNNTTFIASVARILGVEVLQAATDDMHGQLLHAATKNGHLRVVKFLLECKCNVGHRITAHVSRTVRGTFTTTEQRDATALQIACYRDDSAIILALLEAKANPTVTHLQLACERDNLEILERLFKAKANPTIKDKFTDCTPRPALIAAALSRTNWSNCKAIVAPALELMLLKTMDYIKSGANKRAKPFVMVASTLNYD